MALSKQVIDQQVALAEANLAKAKEKYKDKGDKHAMVKKAQSQVKKVKKRLEAWQKLCERDQALGHKKA